MGMDVVGNLHDPIDQHDFGAGSGMVPGSLVSDKYYDLNTISAKTLRIAGFYALKIVHERRGLFIVVFMETIWIRR